MNHSVKKVFVVGLGIALTAIVFQNCSRTSFENTGSESSGSIEQNSVAVKDVNCPEGSVFVQFRGESVCMQVKPQAAMSWDAANQYCEKQSPDTGICTDGTLNQASQQQLIESSLHEWHNQSCWSQTVAYPYSYGTKTPYSDYEKNIYSHVDPSAGFVVDQTPDLGRSVAYALFAYAVKAPVYADAAIQFRCCTKVQTADTANTCPSGYEPTL